MLPRKYRLRSSADISQIFRGGKPFFSNGIGCKVLFERKDEKRIGFVSSKRIFPKATDRNRAKRILSEAVSCFLSDIPDGADLLFFFQKKDASLDLKTVEIAVSKIIREISDFIRE